MHQHKVLLLHLHQGGYPPRHLVLLANYGGYFMNYHSTIRLSAADHILPDGIGIKLRASGTSKSPYPYNTLSKHRFGV